MEREALARRRQVRVSLEDVFARRTRSLLLANQASAAAATDVAALIGPELGWTKERVDHEVGAFTALAAKERQSAGLPLDAPAVAS